MTQEERDRLADLRSAGTLNRQQIDDLLALVKLEEEDAKVKVTLPKSAREEAEEAKVVKKGKK